MSTAVENEIRVAILDHQPVVCESLTAALSGEPGIRAVGWATAAPQAASLVEDRRYDVLVVASAFAPQQGFDVFTYPLPAGTAAPVVMVMGAEDRGGAASALRKGARAFVLATSSLRTLVEAIRAAAQGQIWACPELVASLLQEVAGHAGPGPTDRLACLSKREREVLELLVEGLGLTDISARLFLSANTVRTHSQNLQRKLGVRSAVGAVSVALEAGLRPIRFNDRADLLRVSSPVR